MPASYQSWLFEPEDTVDQKQRKLYLAAISCEEDAYRLGAALTECRKQLTLLDKQVQGIREGLREVKDALH